MRSEDKDAMTAARPKLVSEPSTVPSAEPVATPEEMANAIRLLAADAVQKAKSGHPGMPMGMATAAMVLWTRFLKFDPTRPDWEDRDRFILSAGHGSMLLYALLYLSGYQQITIEEIKNFRQLGSKTPGHPEYEVGSGIETTTGPLAQGLGNAVGMALAERLRNARLGNDIVDHYTYCIVGDGCLMEGLSQEAISFAGHQRLAKLIVLWDDNEISIDGPTSLSTGDNQMARFEACGWDAQTVDGDDPEAVARALTKARLSDKPSLIDCRTIIGKGAPNKGGTEQAHGAPLGDDEIAGARKTLNWPYPPFVIPQHVLAAWRKAGERSTGLREAWEQRFAALSSNAQAAFRRASAGKLTPGWQAPLNAFKRKLADDQPKWPTRKASGEALEILTATFPEMIGGSADLSDSVFTKTRSVSDILPGDYTGRYVHYGVREHAMAAVMNGMALHGGFIPYGGTFLVFADYMRGSMRMSALMRLRVIYVLTHDFDRRRRGRPDPSSHRDPGQPAGDAEHAGVPAGRRGRDLRVLGDRADRERHAVVPGAEPPGGAGGASRARERQPRRPRRLRPARGGRRPARSDPVRHRLGGARRRRGARPSAGRRHPDRGGLDAVLGAVRHPAREVSEGGDGAELAGVRARRRRGRHLARLGPLHRRERRLRRPQGLRQVRSGRRAVQALRHHRRERGDPDQGGAGQALPGVPPPRPPLRHGRGRVGEQGDVQPGATAYAHFHRSPLKVPR